MGFTIYLPSYSAQALVHECVHTWQFQFGGFGYIGNSALNQLDSLVFSRGYDPYKWRPAIDAGESWFTLRSTGPGQIRRGCVCDGLFRLLRPRGPGPRWLRRVLPRRRLGT